MNIMVTGAAGFIGFHVSKQLLDRGDEVYGIDNISDYYSVSLKEARLAKLLKYPSFSFYKVNIADYQNIDKIFENRHPDYVINLGAQSAVRHSFQNPYAYTESNLSGFVNILECCRLYDVKHLVYASSSSVYGNNRNLPFSVVHNVDHPINFYAATKKANELMAHVYSHLYNLPTTGLRFFTVYGPWGRPDMAYFIFTKAILENRPIDVYNYGKMRRDFIYIDDIVKGILLTINSIPKSNICYSPENPTPESCSCPYRLYNIGNNQSVELNYFIEIIENALGKKSIKNMLPMQPEDTEETLADIDTFMLDFNFRPNTPIELGIPRFIEWYLDYHKVNNIS